jgi:hypothetical protein
VISLSDKQLDIITQVAAALPVEKRGDYLQRVAAHLQIRLGRYTWGGGKSGLLRNSKFGIRDTQNYVCVRL